MSTNEVRTTMDIKTHIGAHVTVSTISSPLPDHCGSWRFEVLVFDDQDESGEFQGGRFGNRYMLWEDALTSHADVVQAVVAAMGVQS